MMNTVDNLLHILSHCLYSYYRLSSLTIKLHNQLIQTATRTLGSVLDSKTYSLQIIKLVFT